MIGVTSFGNEWYCASCLDSTRTGENGAGGSGVWYSCCGIGSGGGEVGCGGWVDEGSR